MGKFLKYFAILIGVVIVIAVGAVLYILYGKSMPEAPDIKVELTDERIERGEYLAHHVSMCIDCHSERDYSKFSGPVKPGTEGKGGEPFDKKRGLPGDFYAANLTPYHLGDWTDGEIYRAISMGVSKDGRPLFPIMPYHSYGKMSEEDVYSIIAYLRTLDPIKNGVPPAQVEFPMSAIMKIMPHEANHQEIPPKSDLVAYGRYVSNAAACADCHTPMEEGRPIKEMVYAGGMELITENGYIMKTANITPDKKTGIGSWTKEMFVQRFKMYADSSFNLDMSAGHRVTGMPWVEYAGMTEEDLGAIYEYLMNDVKPIENAVITTPSKYEGPKEN
jgi:mono/diheme cytochrome c family protein